MSGLKITNHRKSIVGIVLSAVLALILLAILRGDRGSYVVVLVVSFTGIVLLRSLELNSRVLRTSARQLRHQNDGFELLKKLIDAQGVALAGLQKNQHSNELRLRRIGDWSKSSAASVEDAKGLLHSGAEKLDGTNMTLSEMMRMFDRFNSDQRSNEKRLRRLNESVKSLGDDATKILSDGHSNELRLRKLAESIGSLAENARKFDENQHSNELRLRRLVDMNRRLDEKIVEFAESINSQTDIQYVSDSLIKYQLLEGLFDLNDAVGKKGDK